MQEVMMYFPDKLPKGKLPERKYFFDVLSTIKPDYTDNLIRHANEQRHKTKMESSNKRISR